MAQAAPQARRSPAWLPRLKKRRWLVVVIGGIVAVVGASGALVVPAPKSCDVCSGCIPPNAGPTPLGSAFAIGAPTAQGGPSNRSYEMEITPSSGMVWSTLYFQLWSSNGAILTPGAQWAVLASNSTSHANTPFASYDFLSGKWSGEATVLMTSGQLMTLSLGSTNLAGMGDKFVVYIPTGCPGAFGQVSVALP